LKWDLWQDAFAERIVAVAGDLRLPRLGIDERTYETLCRSIDCIYHCATSMNHLETYAMAKAANVGAVKEILRIATEQKSKLVNYVSTMSVFNPSATETMRVVTESSPIEDERHLSSIGYSASKWVGEKIFLIAGGRGIPCNVFRLGLVWADAERGRYDELQRGYRILKTCLLSRYGIKNYRLESPPTPVDYVARSIVFLANRHAHGGGIFHISSSWQPPTRVFERCNEVAGTKLELVPYHEWVDVMKKLHLQGRSLPAAPLIEFGFSMEPDALYAQQRAVANLRFDATATHRELEQAGIRAPALDDDLLKKCIADMYARDAELRELEDWPDDAPLMQPPESKRSHEYSGLGTKLR
jgi:thioester reductase-like protein